MLLWTDIETTGLDHRTRQILSVGMIATDDNVRELGRVEYYIHHDPAVLHWDDGIKEMHEKSGVLQKVLESPNDGAEVTAFLVEFIHKHGMRGAYLSGNSIHFDRRWLDYHIPSVTSLLHYRMLDVSTLKIISSLWLPSQVPDFGAKSHSPLADLDHSIRELGTWKHMLFREGIGPVLPFVSLPATPAQS